jgi:hypothetical protein
VVSTSIDTELATCNLIDYSLNWLRSFSSMVNGSSGTLQVLSSTGSENEFLG